MIAALLFAAATCVPPTSQELVGFWESRTTSTGGIGGTLLFRADGSLVNAVTVIVNSTYQLDGDRLRLRLDQAPADKEPQTQQIRVEPGALVVIANGTETRKERVGSAVPGAPSIVGVYRNFAPAMKSTVYERYGADGRMQFRMPIASQKGCYSLHGDRVVFDFEGKPPSEHRFAARGDALRIESEGQKEPGEWGRVAGGGWYEIEKGVARAPGTGQSPATAETAGPGGAPLACTAPASMELIGLWQGEPKIQSPAALGRPAPSRAKTLSYLFRADGTFAQAMTADGRGTYRLDGERLERKPADARTNLGLPDVSISFEGDRLVERPQQGPVRRMRRLSAAVPGAAPIVGRWMSDGEASAGILYESFDEQGSWEAHWLVNRFEGCFELGARTVQLVLRDGHRAPPLRWKLRGDRLTLRLEVPGEENLFPELTRQASLTWYLAPGSEPPPKPSRPPTLPTLPGPEAKDLAQRVKGKLVVATRRALDVIDLPSLTRTSLPVNSYFWGGERFTDPDANGRFVFFFAQGLGTREKYESNLGGTLEGQVSSYTLVSMSIDGKGARELLKFESPELYAVGLDLEQSRLGRRVAYLRDVDNVKVTTATGFCPVSVARLRIFDAFWMERTLEREAIDRLNCRGDRGRMLAWHPDERRLAYVALAQPATVAAERARLGEFGREFFDDRWEQVPVVHLLDIETDQDIALGPGASLLFSDDGRKLVVGDTENRWRSVDLESRVSTPLELPGNWRGPLALLSNGLILYLALPTAGEESTVGTLKILDPATGRYQTVLEDAGARMRFRAAP